MDIQFQLSVLNGQRGCLRTEDFNQGGPGPSDRSPKADAHMPKAWTGVRPVSGLADYVFTIAMLAMAVATGVYTSTSTFPASMVTTRANLALLDQRSR
jgi:hypothetical protein